jgi:hypothetical protein
MHRGPPTREKAKNMQRTPPTAETLRRNFLNETFVWTRTDQKERQALRTHTIPTEMLPTELEHSAANSAIF